MIPGVNARKTRSITRKHRPAIWECMLGTVYASNPEGQTRYFDYKYKAALKHAQLGDDVRICRAPRRMRAGDDADMVIRKGQIVVWTL